MAVTSRDILNTVSRSFALVIPMLDDNKMAEVENQYLLARMLDTIEDSSLEYAAKEQAMEELFSLLESGSGSIDSLVSTLAPATIDNHDLLLVNNFGMVYDTYRRLDDDIKELAAENLVEMGMGMLEFLRGDGQYKINTFDDLDRYCYYVAGTVGIYLTGLAFLKDEVMLSNEQAKSFGRYLQKVNIIKDVHKDTLEGRYFWPSELFNGRSKRPGLEHLSRMIASADKEHDSTFGYIASIPKDIMPGYRRFCKVAAMMGAETLKLMKDNPDVFDGNVKISREQLAGILSESND